jgi:Ras-related protein Rab-7A
MSNYLEYDKLIKCIVLGNSNVGKTTLCHNLINKDLPGDYLSTIGVDFFTHIFEINNYKLKLHLWDTAGQERFNAVVKSFYRQAQLAIYVFSYNDINSFNQITKWRDEMNLYCNNIYNEIIIGTKIDLNNKVNKIDVTNYCIDNGISLININLLRENIELKLVDIIKEFYIPSYLFSIDDFENIKINDEDNIKQNNCCTIL